MAPGRLSEAEKKVNFDSDFPPASTPDPADPARPAIEPKHEGPTTTEPSEVPAAPPAFVPGDLRAPWGWLDLLLLGLVAIAVFLGLAVILVAGLVAAHVRLTDVQSSPRLSGVLNVVADIFLFGGLLGYLALQIRLRFRAPFWRTIGWRPLDTAHLPHPISYAGFVAVGLVLAFVVQIGSALFGTKAKLPIEKLFQDRLTVILILALSVLMAPLVEETIFRGYIYPVVARSFGQGVGVVVTGTLFGLLHAAQLWGGWTQIVLLVFVGLVLTYIRAVTKTVLASYLVHLAYNFTVSVGFLVGSHGLKALPPGP
jgi:membrane protease YdiL (CAAX protease family)